MADEIKDTAPLADAEPTPQAGAEAKPELEAKPLAGGDLSPDELSKALKDARKEAAGYRTKLRDFEEKERQAQEASLSELEKAQKRAAELEARLEATQAEAWRAQAAAKAKLPAELAARITGKTLSDMEADADQLAKLIAKPAPPAGVQPTNPGKDDKAAPTVKRNAPVDIFDPAFVATHGGGAFSIDKE